MKQHSRIPILRSDRAENIVLPDIIQAAYAGKYKLVEQLIDSGVDVNTLDPRDNITSLHIACMGGDKKLVEVILQRELTHGDVDFEVLSSHRPRTAWQFALNAHHYEIARLVDGAGLNKLRRIKLGEPTP